MAAALPRVTAAIAVLLCAITCLSACAKERLKTLASQHPDVEARGVWLTTNSGLDWPQKIRGEEAQKRALTHMLDRLADANFNLVIFQVQANGDVLWPSSLEPPMTTVATQRPGVLDYDVCNYVVDECHRRGLECHAWIVPFRMGSQKHIADFASSPVPHPGALRRDMCVDYQGTLWLDPGIPANRQWLIDLYREMVRSTRFDGISLDYTRYPGADFPDADTYARYAPQGVTLTEWRRSNLNTFVADLSRMVASERPAMLVGSAPIGTYRNVAGFHNAAAYDDYCQDPIAWVAAGGHHIIVPQLYWDEKYGYTPNLARWTDEVAGRATILAGLAAYKMDTSSWLPDTLVSQILKARTNSAARGVVFFRAEHVIGDSPRARTLYDRLRNDLFKTPARLPWRK